MKSFNAFQTHRTSQSTVQISFKLVLLAVLWSRFCFMTLRKSDADRRMFFSRMLRRHRLGLSIPGIAERKRRFVIHGGFRVAAVAERVSAIANARTDEPATR